MWELEGRLGKMKGVLALVDGVEQLLAHDLLGGIVWQLQVVLARHYGGQMLVGVLLGFAFHHYLQRRLQSPETYTAQQ